MAGSVTFGSPAGPAAGTCVEVVSSSQSNIGGVGFVGANGQYVVSGLAPGSYTVEFNDPICQLFGPANLAPQWYNDQPTQATANAVTVTVGNTTTGIDAALQPDGQISGTVTGPGAAPVSGACVTAVPQGGATPPIVAISHAGQYSLGDMLPGNYKVKFSSGCGATGYQTQWWQDASSASSATVVTVSPNGDVTGIDATLAR